MHATKPEMAKKWEKEKKDEAAKRDYKDEYEKFQSSDKSKKYRAELNKYNRDKGTYGNGDGKDASHKGGKIVGFEKESKNRGRAEKSRLKKESPDFNPMIDTILDDVIKEYQTTNESVNERDNVGMAYKRTLAKVELKKIKDAILMFQKKIKKQGSVTNARDEDHIKNLIKVYKQMGGTGVKESVLKKNPGEFVDAKFSKAIDNLPNSKLTKDLVIKLAKKYKVDQDDALRFVSYGYLRDFGLKESVNEGLSGSILTKVKKNSKDVYGRTDYTADGNQMSYYSGNNKYYIVFHGKKGEVTKYIDILIGYSIYIY